MGINEKDIKTNRDYTRSLCCLTNSEICGRCEKKLGCPIHFYGSKYFDDVMCWPCRGKYTDSGGPR